MTLMVYMHAQISSISHSGQVLSCTLKCTSQVLIEIKTERTDLFSFEN